jgi:hypothetical protein
MRLLGRRLILATVALAVVLGGLFWVCPYVSAVGPPPLPPMLTDQKEFLEASLLGALGALLSFAVGSFHQRVDYYRIYELTSGNIATTVARILIGASSALVLMSATHLNVLPIRAEWSALVGVAAGFSERLVRRVVESLSKSAEAQPERPHAPSRTEDGHGATAGQ